MTSNIVKGFKPLLDRVLVQKIAQTLQTKTGLYLPESLKGGSSYAKVLATGAGRMLPQGQIVPVSVKAGDTVLVPEYGGVRLNLDDQEYHVYKSDDLIAIINP